MKDFVMAFEGWKAQARKLKQEVYALYLASGDRRVPWYARVVAIVVGPMPSVLLI